MADPAEGYQFIAEGEVADMGRAFRDSTVLNQRLVHLLEGVTSTTVPDDNPAKAGYLATIEEIRTQARISRLAAEASVQQGEAERLPISITRLPTPWGANAFNPMHIRKATEFTGKSADKFEVFRWLSSCAMIARANGYSRAAFASVVTQTATEDARDKVMECVDEGMTADQMVQCLEVMYGNTMSPMQALTRVGLHQRRPGQSILSFNQEVKTMGLMAVRNMANRDEANAKVADIVKQNMLRVIHPLVQKEVSAAMSAHLLSSRRPMTNMELEALITRTEDQREELKKALLRQKEFHKVHSAQFLPEEDFDIEEDSFLVNAAMEKKERDRHKGRQVSGPGAARAAIRKHNKMLDVKKAAAAAEGPPGRLAERGQTISELLKLANVVRGECLQCGLPGHIKESNKCALRGRHLTDKPCLICGKGLHDASDCTKLNAAAAVEDSEDNDSENEI